MDMRLNKNKKFMRIFSFLLLLFSLTFFVSKSYGDDDHNHSDSAAHIHGEAALNIVMAESLLEIEFISPAYNLVGFEHKANSSEENATVKQAILLLEDPIKIFKLTDAKCELKKTLVDSDLISEEKHHHHDHHHEAKETKSESHLDFRANYSFFCEQASFPSAIKISLFEYFDNLTKVKSKWISNQKQGYKVLTSNDKSIQF